MFRGFELLLIAERVMGGACYAPSGKCF